MFGQIRKIIIDDMVFEFTNLDIEFEIASKEGLNSETAKVQIYNLSKSTLERLKKGQSLIVEAGYPDNSGVIFNGTVDTLKTELEGVDYVTTIVGTPSNNTFTNTIINVQYNKGITAEEVLKSLEQIIPYKIRLLDIPKNIQYTKGKAFSTRLSNVIKIICADIGAIGTFEKNEIVIKAPNKIYTKLIKLGSINGLIAIKRNSEKNGVDSYTLESVLNPQLKRDQLLEVDSLYYKGRYKITQIKYIAKDVNTFNAICNVEVVK